MGAHLDLIASFVIGGLVLLMLFSTNANILGTSAQNTLDTVAQQNLSVIAEMVLHDFHKIGYYPSDVPPDDFRILKMDSTAIRFRADIDNNGFIDTVAYSVGDTSEASGTPNPRDVILYRLVNNETRAGAALGLTEFHLEYFDADGSPTAVPSNVRTIEVMLAAESTYAYDNYYPRAIWRSMVRPRNLAIE